MSENTATGVLEEGQEDGHIRASDPRPPLDALTAARDGGFAKVPRTGHGIVAELNALYGRIVDRPPALPHGSAVRQAGVGAVRPDRRAAHRRPRAGRVDGPRQRGRPVARRLVAPAANATRVLDTVADGGLIQRVDPHDGPAVTR
ncbi:hypothetical protein GCM10027072_57250 [Streptomyces bullii]